MNYRPKDQQTPAINAISACPVTPEARYRTIVKLRHLLPLAWIFHTYERQCGAYSSIILLTDSYDIVFNHSEAVSNGSTVAALLVAGLFQRIT